jgi:isochorismate synthase
MRAAQWGQKEIEEQALVSRYIINCFKKVRVREYDDVGPRTVQAGNLWHLQTDFSVDLSEVRYPNFATEMLLLLHPTSAVCGMPKKPALAFLEEHEQYNRRLYSGYLGPVNVNGYTRLHVNLRCMQVTQHELLFYIGGGITADSDPQREWQETQHKRRSLWPL